MIRQASWLGGVVGQRWHWMMGCTSRLIDHATRNAYALDTPAFPTCHPLSPHPGPFPILAPDRKERKKDAGSVRSRSLVGMSCTAQHWRMGAGRPRHIPQAGALAAGVRTGIPPPPRSPCAPRCSLQSPARPHQSESQDSAWRPFRSGGLTGRA